MGDRCPRTPGRAGQHGDGASRPQDRGRSMRTASTGAGLLGGRSTAWELVGTRHPPMITARTADLVRISRSTCMVVPLSLARPSQAYLWIAPLCSMLVDKELTSPAYPCRW